jgi:hypothetical protein
MQDQEYQEFCISYKNINNSDSDSDDSDFNDLLLDGDIYNTTYMDFLDKSLQDNKIKKNKPFINKHYEISSHNDYYITNNDGFTTDIANCITNIIKVNNDINDIDDYILNDNCMIDILYHIIETLWDMDHTIEKKDFEDEMSNIKIMTTQKITDIINSQQFQNDFNNFEIVDKNGLLNDAIYILDCWLLRD